MEKKVTVIDEKLTVEETDKHIKYFTDDAVFTEHKSKLPKLAMDIRACMAKLNKLLIDANKQGVTVEILSTWDVDDEPALNHSYEARITKIIEL